MSYSDNNPSDIDGVTRRQETVIGVVVSNKDPKETGRVRVRILGEQHEGVSDDELPWLPVLTNGFPQMGGVGRFPAGGAYLPGSRIVLRNVGQQGFIVEGAIQSSRTEQGKEDRHPEATSTSPVKVRDGQDRMHRRVFEGSKQANEIQHVTSVVMKVLNEGGLKWDRVQHKEKINQIIEQAKTSIQYNERPNARVKEGENPMPISPKAWDFALNAQKFVQQIPNGELIKGSVSMLENLKATAKQSLNPMQMNSLGGIQNILQALMSIINMIKKHKPKKKVEEPPDQKEQEILDLIDELNRLIVDEPNDNPTS